MTTLWLSPSGAVEAGFRSLIERYSVELDTASFAPHVTLLSGWPDPGTAQARALLSCLTPVAVPVRGVSSSSELFRCVVIELELTKELRAMRREARRVVGAPDEDEYKPHLSLVYGDVAFAERERIRTEAARELPTSILLDRLDIVDTDGPVERWKVVARFPIADAGR